MSHGARPEGVGDAWARLLLVQRVADVMAETVAARAWRLTSPATAGGRAWRAVAAHAVANRSSGTCQALLDIIADHDPLE